MLINLAIVIIIALLLSKIFEKFNLPGLLGMMLTGILLGKYSAHFISTKVPSYIYDSFANKLFLSPEILHISGELRRAALIVILIRAGLGISKKTLNKIGIPALKMSCIPGIFEGITIAFIGHWLLKLPYLESGILGFIIAAVSPAVVVPQMLGLKEEGHGEEKEIPTLILAGSSVDDIFAITIFGALLNMTSKNNTQSLIMDLINIPISVIVGISLGLLVGLLLVKYFKSHKLRDTKKAIIIMITAIIFFHLGELKFIPIASLLGIMAISFTILEKHESLAKAMSIKFNQIWVLAEIILFVLIGAEVNIGVIFQAGFYGLIIIFIGIIARSIGVWVSLIASHLNNKEKIFCMIAYIPKATVQAAIGGIALAKVKTGEIALSNGSDTGELLLAIAVLSIITTAPIGAIGIKFFAPRLLQKKSKI